ncbi:MAG: beta-galactosidase [Lachnospiraceae bacterium]|nr:beta-galactosidase [Lachnospiraceae bacterium]
MSVVTIDENDIRIGAEPFHMISGAIHYFRVVPEYWEDRLLKLKAMGCNTVETYIPWNLHEPKRGTFCFEGICDVERFVRLAAELELYVILRPSPYICAEWEFGGLPAWLLKEDGMKLRCSYEPYLQAVEAYYRELMPRLTKYQIDLGGPVILMQVENEYGYYGNDKKYLKWLADLMRSLGVTVPLFVSDGPFAESFRCGGVDDLWHGGNFGSHAEERFAGMRTMGKGPLACTEFWLGWFDHWGCGGHHTTSREQNVKDLAYMLDHGHVNIYMFEGGTNFGFMNGSNYYDELTPDVTSYDYDAVLTEDGRITGKYEAFREEIGKRYPLPELPLPPEQPRMAYGMVPSDGAVSLWDALDLLSEPHESVTARSMERLDQSYGYILYTARIPETDAVAQIRLMDAADRAKIYADGKEILTLYDWELLAAGKCEPPVPCPEHRLDILMENMGRVNFGPAMEKQRKGIDGPVLVNDHQIFDFEIRPLPLDHTEKLIFGKDPCPEGPSFRHFTLEVKETCDTFLNMAGWGKGCVFVNGFPIGRYWEIGPQVSLYVPAPVLKKGKNEIIIFETEGRGKDTIVFEDRPNLGAPLPEIQG